MRQSIGATATFNIIIIFILVVFSVLCATLSYYKAFKVNSAILSIIDKYEGYNRYSISEIDTYLDSIGYKKSSANCSETRDNIYLVGTNGDDYNADQDENYAYCVYYYNDDRGENVKNTTNDNKEPIYYNYSVVTYIFVDMPIINNFKIPIHTKGERIYNFSKNK